MWHWSNDSKEGSEHYLNGKQYPMEIQLYHYNTKYNSYDDAVGNPEGLAAVSFFYEISEEPNQQQENLIEATKRLEDETRHMGIEFEVRYVTGTVNQLLLPEGGVQNTDNYFHYDGSLTLPRNSSATNAEDCEPVKWIVFEKKIPIAESQLEYFRSLLVVATADATFFDSAVAGLGLSVSLCPAASCSNSTTALAKQMRGCICGEDLMCVHNFRPIHPLNPPVTARGLHRMYFCLFIQCLMFLCFRSGVSKNAVLQTEWL